MVEVFLFVNIIIDEFHRLDDSLSLLGAFFLVLNFLEALNHLQNGTAIFRLHKSLFFSVINQSSLFFVVFHISK